MRHPLPLILAAAAGLALLTGAGWLWLRYGTSVFLGGGVSFC